MKRILITGASGFIGSYLVEEALQRGYEVYAGVRASSNKNYLSDKRIKFFEVAFTDGEQLKRQLSTFTAAHGAFDFIIHNAGITKAKKKEDYYTVNYFYTKRFVEALKESGSVPKRFVYLSSLAAFGPGKDTTPIRNTDTPNPITAYGKSKLRTEEFLFSLADFPSLIIRPSSVYGPRESGLYVLLKVLNRGIEPYIGSREQLLSFVYAGDLANVIFTAMESPSASRAYFVSDGFAYTIQSFNEIATKHLRKKTVRITIPSVLLMPVAHTMQAAASLFGGISVFNPERVNEFKAPNWLCDAEPLKKELSFSPVYNLDTGLQKTIKWYKDYGWL